VKKLGLVLLFLVLACGFLTVSARADVSVQVASTHAPTEQFQIFVEEFLFAFDELYSEFAPTLRLSQQGAQEEDLKVYLIERQDRGLWQIGLCEPRGKNNPSLGFALAKLSFHYPFWSIEGKEMKDNEKIKKLARQAAEALIRRVGQKQV
jgi:hypothetical protein